jgi:hypothetical protein
MRGEITARKKNTKKYGNRQQSNIEIYTVSSRIGNVSNQPIVPESTINFETK